MSPQLDSHASRDSLSSSTPSASQLFPQSSQAESVVDYDASTIIQVTDIIDGHDTDNTARSINDSVMKDADKLWRYTQHGIDNISSWFEVDHDEFFRILEDFVRPKLLRKESQLIADEFLAIAKTKKALAEGVVESLKAKTVG